MDNNNLANTFAVLHEKLDDEMQKVTQNIFDPNTNATEPREIQLKIKIKPDTSRSAGYISVEAKSKLASAKAWENMCFFGKNSDGTPVIEERFSNQLDLVNEIEKKEKIENQSNTYN